MDLLVPFSSATPCSPSLGPALTDKRQKALGSSTGEHPVDSQHNDRSQRGYQDRPKVESGNPRAADELYNEPSDGGTYHIPTTTVSRNPPGSLPGIISLPKIPAISPTMILDTIPISIYRSILHSHLPLSPRVVARQQYSGPKRSSAHLFTRLPKVRGLGNWASYISFHRKLGGRRAQIANEVVGGLSKEKPAYLAI